MSMNIKNPESHRLSRELAELTGESLTTAVTVAVAERLDRLQGRRVCAGSAERTERILSAARRLRDDLPPDFLAVDHAQLLYDERGLPR